MHNEMIDDAKAKFDKWQMQREVHSALGRLEVHVNRFVSSYVVALREGLLNADNCDCGIETLDAILDDIKCATGLIGLAWNLFYESTEMFFNDKDINKRLDNAQRDDRDKGI